MRFVHGLGAVLIAAISSATALAQAPGACRNTGSFERWLEAFRQEARGQGISQEAIAAAAPQMTFEQRIVNIDRGQRFFAQDFLAFSGRMLQPYRLAQGPKLIKKYEAIFDGIERQYGVPAAVIVGFWGLESDFGAGMGKDFVLRALTTLAYDCRRSEMFRDHLFGALRLIERGDLAPGEMIGSWAGELGQTQMMPSEYFKYAVDYDGDGRRNLLQSVPDVLGSTANYLVGLGWRRGEPWLQEVRAPADLAWDQADLAITHPRSQWARWGVTLSDGKPLPADGLPASLVLPMGRLGPAFLAYANFRTYIKWNNSLVYSLTAAYYATRLAGAPPFRRGEVVPPLGFEETKALQQLLVKQGHDVGRIDGIVGEQSRTAVKQVQMKLGLPADSYPTAELLSRLRSMR